MHTAGLFDLSDHLERLSQSGDPLEALERHVDFEAFRPVLLEALGYGERPKGGRVNRHSKLTPYRHPILTSFVLSRPDAA